MSSNEISIQDSIKRDMAEISWAELKVRCPQDALILVSNDLDLVEVAVAIAEDNTEQVSDWMENGQIKQTSDKEVSHWDQKEPIFLGAYVTPFVLVQEQGLKT